MAVILTGKKFNFDEMQDAIRNNWSQFERRMKEEWSEFRDEELAEAKENLHSFVVQVEHRTHESGEYVKGKLTEWRNEILNRERPPTLR